MRITLLLVAPLLVTASLRAGANQDVKPAQAKPGLSVNISGSDTLAPLLAASAEALSKAGKLQLSVSGGGSGVGIAQLAGGRADLAATSRALKPAEKAKLEAGGAKVTEVLIARGAIVVCVHPDNPVKSLTFAQLTDIWQKDGTTKQWLDIEKGLSTELIERHAPPSFGPVAGGFTSLLQSQDPKVKLTTEVSTGDTEAAVVEAVADDVNAMGIVGMAAAGGRVKMLPISPDAKSPAIAPSEAGIAGGTYPLCQPLYLITTQPEAEGVKSVLDYLKSEEGRKSIRKAGFIPPAIQGQTK